MTFIPGRAALLPLLLLPPLLAACAVYEPVPELRRAPRYFAPYPAIVAYPAAAPVYVAPPPVVVQRRVEVVRPVPLVIPPSRAPRLGGSPPRNYDDDEDERRPRPAAPPGWRR